MLVITRKKEEKIIIGDTIVVTILDIDNENNTVKLGFEAPVEIEIIREELYEKIQKENMMASKKTNLDLLKNIKNSKNFLAVNKDNRGDD